MTLLLLTSLGITSLNAADTNQPDSHWKTTLYFAGGLGILGWGYYAKKSGDAKAVQRRKGHVIKDELMAESPYIYIPGSQRWSNLNIFVGLMSAGSLCLAFQNNTLDKKTLVGFGIGCGVASVISLKRVRDFKKEYIQAHSFNYIAQLEINKNYHDSQRSQRIPPTNSIERATYDLSSQFTDEIAKAWRLGQKQSI